MKLACGEHLLQFRMEIGAEVPEINNILDNGGISATACG